MRLGAALPPPPSLPRAPAARTTTIRLARGLLLGCLVVASSCSGQQPSPGSPEGLPHASGATAVPAPRAPNEPQRDDATEADRWQSVRAAPYRLELLIPRQEQWAQDHWSGWWRATRGDATSVLRAKVWRAPRATTPHACGERASVWLGELLSARRSEESLAQTRLVIDGRAAQLTTWAWKVGDTNLAGLGALFTVDGRDCIAVLYETRSEGSRAEQIIAGRLALFAEYLAPRVRILSVERQAPRPERRDSR